MHWTQKFYQVRSGHWPVTSSLKVPNSDVSLKFAPLMPFKVIERHWLTSNRSKTLHIHVILNYYSTAQLIWLFAPVFEHIKNGWILGPQRWRHRSVTWPDLIIILYSRHVELMFLDVPKVTSESFHFSHSYWSKTLAAHWAAVFLIVKIFFATTVDLNFGYIQYQEIQTNNEM